MPERQSIQVDYQAFMEVALTAEGSTGGTYERFWDYSTLNMLYLLMQGCPQEPIARFNRWRKAGRWVKKGSKAYSIIRPITVKREDEATGEEVQFRRFKDVRYIFPYSMTEGDELPPAEPREWDRERALGTLGITEVAFELMHANVQGYSVERNTAINPVAKYPFKTLAHEVAHVELGHTSPEKQAEYAAHRGLAEIAAESTAYLVLHELGEAALMNAGERRAYIRGWLRGERPPDSEIRDVCKGTDRVVSAGRSQPDLSTTESDAA